MCACACAYACASVDVPVVVEMHPGANSFKTCSVAESRDVPVHSNALI